MIFHWAKFSTRLYHSHTSQPHEYRRHLFVTSVDPVFHVARARIAEGHPVLTDNSDRIGSIHLLVCMVHVLRWSLIHRKYSCGSYTPVQWIKSIAECYKAAKDSSQDPWTTVPLTGEKEMWPIFRLILALLKACVDQGLLTVLNDVGHEDAMDTSEFERLVTLMERAVKLPKLRHELHQENAFCESY